MIKLQTALLVPALMSIALAVPATIAFADPDSDPSAPASDGTDSGWRATRSTPATITVTAPWLQASASRSVGARPQHRSLIPPVLPSSRLWSPGRRH
ncbi:hypothetical protein [Mycobacteroides abscessus]|uniref:hypothetical protein n=1 Tax=Mycobacteroides abscessus TaxID=36809 RepID=UPI001F1AFF63|nr:hypothetical protein [Mycobacteroides abscessus]